MIGYILRRLLAGVPVLLGVSFVVFLILHLVPGDVAQLIASRSFAAVTPEQTEQMRHLLGLDDPLWLQYIRFLAKAVSGDLGRSFYTNRPVLTSILEQFPATLSLTGAALGIAVVLGMLLGIVSAVKHNTWIDNVAMTFSLG